MKGWRALKSFVFWLGHLWYNSSMRIILIEMNQWISQTFTDLPSYSRDWERKLAALFLFSVDSICNKVETFGIHYIQLITETENHLFNVACCSLSNILITRFNFTSFRRKTGHVCRLCIVNPATLISILSITL